MPPVKLWKSFFTATYAFYDDDEQKKKKQKKKKQRQQGPSLYLVSLFLWPVSCHVPLSQKWHIKFNGNWWALIMIWDSLASYALSLLPHTISLDPGVEGGWFFLPVRVSHFACFPFPFLLLLLLVCLCVLDFFIIKVISADGRTKFIDSISSPALALASVAPNKYGYNISIFTANERKSRLTTLTPPDRDYDGGHQKAFAGDAYLWLSLECISRGLSLSYTYLSNAIKVEEAINK